MITRAIAPFLLVPLFLVACSSGNDSAILYTIGDVGPGGGIVFHFTDDGLHGLEVAPEKISFAPWCNNGSLFSEGIDIGGVDNITDETIADSNSGAENTARIVARCGNESAAEVASAIVWPNGQIDGFLPNKEELNLLHDQRDVVGGFAAAFYWSSSESSSANAWLQAISVSNHVAQFSNKTVAQRVRAVRAF